MFPAWQLTISDSSFKSPASKVNTEEPEIVKNYHIICYGLKPELIN